MARRRLAPTHDLCARMRYIPESDTAWDRKRIDEEMKKLGKPGEDSETGHPFQRYHAGTTRFDLEADGIRDYLVPDAPPPEMWLFKRLPWAVREQIAHLTLQGRHLAARRVSFLAGVVGLENPANEAGEKLDQLLRAEERDDDAIIAAAEAYAAEVIGEVGGAAMLASKDLSPEEKKLSGMRPGALSPPE